MSARKEEDEEENEDDPEDGKQMRMKRKKEIYVNMDVETASALWWTLLGAALFVVGLILMSLSYTTLQLLPTVPYNAAVNLPGVFPQISAQALEGGFVLAVIGFIIMLWGRVRLSRLNLMK